MAHQALTVLVGGHYVDWGVISISVTNAVIIFVMVIVFIAALVVPFPHDHDDTTKGTRS